MNNFLEKHNVEIYSVESEFKADVVERFNRTLKEKMWKQFTIQGNQKWFDILPKLLHDYNNNFHRTIKTTPTNASEHPEKIFDFVMENNDENDRNLSKKQLTPKLKIGDRVRVVKYKYIFTKGFVAKWSDEIFVVSQVLPTAPPTFNLVDLKGEEIIGAWYENELLKTRF